MKRIRLKTLSWLFTSFWLASSCFPAFAGRSYSSGGGHSYSSSSSHSSGGGSSHSFSSSSGGSSHTYSSDGSSGSRSTSTGSSGSSGSSKSFNSGGRSYSSGSSGSESDRHGYSSGKSYSAGSGTKFSSPPPSSSDGSRSGSSSAAKSASKDSSFSFDTAAARARKEESSKSDFNRYKESKSPPGVATSDRVPSGGSVSGGTRSDYSRRNVYVPDVTVIRTRPVRIYNVYSPYYYRPWVTYHDPYNSFFWWWLLDRSLDDRAYWAYHHRYDMDPSRYDALVANNQDLQSRVAQLEAQQIPRDPTYTPTGLDRDLMYSDHYVNQAYSNRPTRSGSAAFWVFGVPLAFGGAAFFIWLIWFKRWQTAT